MAESKDYRKGDVSEWNEGNFKSLRLHQAQDLINRARIYPFKMAQQGSNIKFNYELWIEGAIILFCEGMSKYTTGEYKTISKLKDEIEKLQLHKPPCSIKNTYIKGQTQPAVVVDNKKWAEMKKKIEDFEYEVKCANDKHGLSTRNVGTKGLF